MELPLQITVRDVDTSEAVEEKIRERALKLDRFHSHIMRCDVVVESPHRRQTMRTYNVRVDITVPGKEIVVSREETDDLYVAIRDAFDAARRQLEDYARQQRGDVKHHEPAQRTARIARVGPSDFGFLETPDGREVYFHRNALANGDFEKLSAGTQVHFTEEEGEKGPQAVVVRVV